MKSFDCLAVNIIEGRQLLDLSLSRDFGKPGYVYFLHGGFKFVSSLDAAGLQLRLALHRF